MSALSPQATSAAVDYLLRMGDTDLVLSHRLSEWCGHGPALEEDLALANTALDLLGQARLWLALAAEREGRGRDEDALAYLRDGREWRNALLAEQPNGSYAHSLVRQFLFDAWHALALGAFSGVRDAEVAAIAAKGAKEVAYHLRRSSDLVVRLGDGTPDSHARMQEALDALWMYSGELFSMDTVDEEAREQGMGIDLGALRAPWLATIEAVCGAATLKCPPADAWMQKGGKQGRHSEHLGYVLAELQFLQRAYPGASW